MCISHRGQKELKFIKRMQLLKTRTTTKQKSGVSEPMGQSALQIFFLSEKTRAVATRGTWLAIVPADYGRNRSKSFFFKWLWLQQLAPPDCQTFPTAGPDKNLHAKKCILRITKKIMLKLFHWQAFYYWRNYTTQQITSSTLEFGTRIPIRILEDVWSEFLIIFIKKKKKITYIWSLTSKTIYQNCRFSS